MSSANTSNGQSTRWADGLRGIAAVGVVSSHMVLAYSRVLMNPCVDGFGGPMLLFQRPFFRLIAQGQSYVALFFILMGFVNSLKALKQAQSDKVEDALLTLAKSALNRTARLVLPATAITIIAWIACELGLFEIARLSDAYWLRVYAAKRSANVGQALYELIQMGLLNTWLRGDNIYDQPQWALRYLLLGSMTVFLVLLITITMRPKFRLMALVILYVTSWLAGDFLTGTNVYFGVILAQLHTLDLLSSTKSLTGRCLAFVLAMLGLFFMSFPHVNAWDASWSRILQIIGTGITPYASDLTRFWPGIGAQILCIAIMISSDMQEWLSGRVPVYLGGVSFSLYLLHGPLMKTILAWMMFLPGILHQPELVVGPRNLYQMPSDAWFFLLILPVFLTILMAAVHGWSAKVEPIFARTTKRLEGLVTGSSEGKHVLKHSAPLLPLVAVDGSPVLKGDR